MSPKTGRPKSANPLSFEVNYKHFSKSGLNAVF